MFKIIAIGLCFWLCAGWTLATANKNAKYTNVWVAKIIGGEQVALRVARDFGYTYKGPFSSFEDYYELLREDHPRVNPRSSDHLTKSLLNLDEVEWAKQQKVRRIVYKALTDSEIKSEEDKTVLFLQTTKDQGLADNSKNMLSSRDWSFSIGGLFGSGGSNVGSFPTRQIDHQHLTTYRGTTQNIELLRNKMSAYETEYDDPMWKDQWYLQDYRTTDMAVMDHNVVPVHRMGYTGQGVTVAVVDTPIQIDHPDIKSSIDMGKSFDMCSNRPLSHAYRSLTPKTHGTSCAGIIGMVKSNQICGTGIAYDAKIAAINIDCGESQPESNTAKAILQNLDQVDIYSNSWGPEDNPSVADKLSDLERQAYLKGVTEGRNGNGTIYVHGAGNGGLLGDNCWSDCFINQPYVIAITSANQYGKKSDYAERCTAIFATTYSGNFMKYNRKNVEGTVTLDTDSKCQPDFAGTSASSSVASGIIALLLQFRPDLKYRDVMHLIAATSEVAPLANNPDSWYMNGAGFWVSNEFGFGLMNAENLIEMAKDWKKVPDKHTCTIKLNKPQHLSGTYKALAWFTIGACKLTDNSVAYLEHIEVIPTIEYSGYRGDIQMTIKSPARTKSVIIERRRQDEDKNGIMGWNIMSTHFWGEHPHGDWVIQVDVPDDVRTKGHSGHVKEIFLRLHGTLSMPAYAESRRKYAAFRLPNKKTELNTDNF